MNKNKIYVAILLSIIALNTPIVFAQDFVIPEPACIETPGIPCPDRNGSYEKAQKPTSAVNRDVPTGFSKVFNFLSKNIDKVVNDLRGGFKNIFDGLRNFFSK